MDEPLSLMSAATSVSECDHLIWMFPSPGQSFFSLYFKILIYDFLILKPVASILEIPLENIYANQLLFGDSGEFLGFDEKEPTSRSGGKPIAVQQIRKVCSIGLLLLYISLFWQCLISQRISYGPLLFICSSTSGSLVQNIRHDWWRSYRSWGNYAFQISAL